MTKSYDPTYKLDPLKSEADWESRKEQYIHSANLEVDAPAPDPRLDAAYEALTDVSSNPEDAIEALKESLGKPGSASPSQGPSQ